MLDSVHPAGLKLCLSAVGADQANTVGLFSTKTTLGEQWQWDRQLHNELKAKPRGAAGSGEIVIR